MGREIGYCGNHCEYCFLWNVMVAKVKIQVIPMQIYLMIKNVLMLFVVKARILMAVGNAIK